MHVVSTAPESVRRTKAERSESSRTALLEATIEALDEVGYAKLSVGDVARRAGLSVGAHLHHYRTKAALVAAAVDYLAQQRIAELRAELAENRYRNVDGLLDVAWKMYSGRLFRAALQLWIASRCDEELRELVLAFEEDIDREVVRVATHTLGVDRLDPQTATFLRLIMAAMRGTVARVSLRQDADLDHEWKPLRRLLLNAYPLVTAEGLAPETDRVEPVTMVAVVAPEGDGA